MAIYIQIMSKRAHFFKSVGRGPPPPCLVKWCPKESSMAPAPQPGSGAGSRPTEGAMQDPSCRCYGQKISQLPAQPPKDLVRTHTATAQGESGHRVAQSCKAGVRAAECHQVMSSSCQQSADGVWCIHTSTSLWSLQAEVEEKTLFQPFFLACHESNSGVQRTDHFPM